MPEIKIYSDGWVATILTGTRSPDGFWHIYATSEGETRKHALEAVKYVLDAFAFGRLAVLRVEPEAVSETDFDTKITSHRGIVRFSYKLHAGEWHYPKAAQLIPGIGTAA